MTVFIARKKKFLYNFFIPALLSTTHGLQIPVLYESKHLLVINKPHGVAHHEDADAPGILQLIRAQRQASNATERLWGVHRLDKVTSGILVLAKDQTTASTLSKFFADGRIKKIYVGVSSKKPKKKKQGWVNGEMVRSRRETWMLTRKSEKESTNYAKTRFFTAGMQTDSSSKGEVSSGPRTVIMFVPHTGKTHQLRVAAESMGIALMGDPLYSDGTAATVEDVDGCAAPRTMLHASGISIPPLGSDDDNCDAVSIWCEPPFFDEWRSTPGDDSLAEATAFHQAVERLMTKHCEEQRILDAMLKKSESNII